MPMQNYTKANTSQLIVNITNQKHPNTTVNTPKLQTTKPHKLKSIKSQILPRQTPHYNNPKLSQHNNLIKLK